MNSEELVIKVEAAYQSQDVDRMMEFFDPEIVVYWNGQKRAEGIDEVRTFHEEMYSDLQKFDIRKSLRAADGDTIAVEWTSTWVDADGNHKEGYGGEFWTMHDGQLREWHAYHAPYDHEETDDRRGERHLPLP